MDTRPISVCEQVEENEARVDALRSRMVEEKVAARLAEVFKTLGDPTRLRIISALADGEACVHELAQALGLSQSAVSHQLRLLRQQGLVRFRKVGRHVYYTLDDEHIHALFLQGLEHVEHG